LRLEFVDARMLTAFASLPVLNSGTSDSFFNFEAFTNRREK